MKLIENGKVRESEKVCRVDGDVHGGGGGGAGEGGEGGRQQQVALGVKLDQESRELLTWLQLRSRNLEIVLLLFASSVPPPVSAFLCVSLNVRLLQPFKRGSAFTATIFLCSLMIS
ncbi:hypothetical protein Ancab_000469 [Ancistrocladus abbreviatus]